MRFTVNFRRFADAVAETLKRKFVPLKSNAFREDCARLYAEKVEPYVPKKTGKLRNSYTIVNNGRYIRYNTNYAQKVYEVPARRYTTPNTTHHWDEYAKPYIMEDYRAAVQQLAREYMSRGR